MSCLNIRSDEIKQKVLSESGGKKEERERKRKTPKGEELKVEAEKEDSSSDDGVIASVLALVISGDVTVLNEIGEKTRTGNLTSTHCTVESGDDALRERGENDNVTSTKTALLPGS